MGKAQAFIEGYGAGRGPLLARLGQTWTPYDLGAALVHWMDPTLNSQVTGAPPSKITSPNPSIGNFDQGLSTLRATLAGGALAFDGTDDFLESSAPVTQASAKTLPDGASGEAGKGFTCTGLVRAPDGTWYAGNHGRNDPLDVSDWDSSIVHLSADFSTVLDEILLVPLDATASGAQGVAYDTSNNTLWVCCSQNKKIYNVSLAGALLKTFDVSATFTCNAIAYDPVNDQLIVGAGTNVIRRLNKSTGSVISSFNFRMSAVDIDQFFYDPAYGSAGALYVGWGAANQDFRLTKVDLATSTPIKQWVLPGAGAGEGVFLVGNKLYLLNDGWFHADTPALNRILTYSLDSTNSPDLGTKLTFGFVGRLRSQPSVGSRVLAAGSDPTSVCGVGIYGTTTTNQIRANIKTAAGTNAPTWTVPSGITTVAIHVFVFDTVASTIAYYCNGTLVSSQAIALATGNIPGLVWTLGASYDATGGGPAHFGDADLEGVVIAATNDATVRVKLEGYLAWLNGRSGLLPSGHAYKNARP